LIEQFQVNVIFLNFRVIQVSDDRVEYYMNKVRTDSSFKAAFGASLTKTLFEDQVKDKAKRHTICKDVLLTLPKVIYTIKDFYLIDEFNDKIELLKSAGLIEFWYFQFIDKPSTKAKNKKYPQRLKLQHFEGCFGILCCGSFASFVAFVVESLTKMCVSKFMRKQTITCNNQSIIF
jgi:hypothetical protein